MKVRFIEQKTKIVYSPGFLLTVRMLFYPLRAKQKTSLGYDFVANGQAYQNDLLSAAFSAEIHCFTISFTDNFAYSNKITVLAD